MSIQWNTSGAVGRNGQQATNAVPEPGGLDSVFLGGRLFIKDVYTIDSMRAQP